jgi:hypothetical protein
MPDTLQQIPGNAPAVNRPDYRRPEYVDLAPVRRLSRAMMQGTRAVRALGTDALPKWPDEKMGFYKLRSSIAQVTRYYARTLEALVGMVAGTPPTLAEGTDARLVADWEDIDRRGRHGDVFVRDLTEEALVGGFAAILVDCPPVPEGMRLTLENEQRMGLRPYWVLITADQIVSWIVEAPNWPALMSAYQAGQLTDTQVGVLASQQIMRQVVLYEPTDVENGDFGVVARERYRVLRLTDTGVTFAVWEKRKSEGAAGEYFAMVDQGVMTGANRRPLPAIPLAVCYPKRPLAPFVAEPPAMGVCELNLDHYQLTADRRYLIKHTHSPTLYLFGIQTERDEHGQEKPIRVGPNSLIRSNNSDAKAGYIVAPADALNSSKEERDEIVRQIAALGMSFIGKDRQQGTETAAGRQLDLSAEHATHASIARAVQDALEQALMFHALHREASAPSIQMHPATPAPDVDPQIAALLWQGVLNGRLDVDSWLHYMRAGTLPDDLDTDGLTARLLAEAEALDAVNAERVRDQQPAGDDEEDDEAQAA